MPGQILTSTVDCLMDLSSQGQADVSGNVLASGQTRADPFLIRVRLDNPDTAAKLPPGAAGTFAIYTNNVQATHVIRKVMIRMTSIMSYINPSL